MELAASLRYDDVRQPLELRVQNVDSLVHDVSDVQVVVSVEADAAWFAELLVLGTDRAVPSLETAIFREKLEQKTLCETPISELQERFKTRLFLNSWNKNTEGVGSP